MQENRKFASVHEREIRLSIKWILTKNDVSLCIKWQVFYFSEHYLKKKKNELWFCELEIQQSPAQTFQPIRNDQVLRQQHDVA